MSGSVNWTLVNAISALYTRTMCAESCIRFHPVERRDRHRCTCGRVAAYQAALSAAGFPPMRCGTPTDDGGRCCLPWPHRSQPCRSEPESLTHPGSVQEGND